LDPLEGQMHPRIQRLVFAATVVALTACGGDVPVSPIDILTPSGADGPAAYAVTLADGSTQINVGESVTLRASSTVQRSRMIRWSSSNSSIVSVSSSGTITGRAVGAATVTALGSNGSWSQFRISVVSTTTRTAAVVASVDITAPSASMAVGSSMTLYATPRDSAGNWIPGRTATWSMSASAGSAITVSSIGVVTAVTEGSSVVVATIDGVSNGRYLQATASTQAPTVTGLAISPKTGTTLAPGATRQFSTSATWSDLATRAVGVTYTATGGTISSSGLYTAGQLIGSFMVIANCGCGRADTAAVSIAAVVVSAQLTRLTISPKTATVNAGATQQFAATANWSTGATSLPPIAYSATGGVVTSAGLWTAPSTSGTYKVILAHSGGTLRDTATVTVAATVGSTPPVTIAGAGPNQPSGYSSIYSNPMGTLPPKNPSLDVFGFQNYFGTSALSIRNETSVPEFLRVTFPAGTAGGADYPNAFLAGNAFSSSGNKSRLYIRLRFRISSNWTDNGNTGTKFFFFNQQQGNNHYVNLTEGGQLRPAVNMQSSFGFGTPSGPNHFVAQPLTKGEWHELEILIVANTPGAYNGQLRMWVDGALMQSANDMGYFAAGTTPRFENMYFNPTYGGGRNPVPADQYVDIDHWYVSGAP
jgi:hypothetical protein